MAEAVPPMARHVPLIAASALFVENIDATVLATALASIANDFGVDAVDLKLVLTCYLVSLVVFIPASGWIADRYGTRTVFCWAMAVFAAGSVACALSTGLWSLVFARILQGAGGAMMIPTARLVVVRSVPKNQLIGAMAVLTTPALIGPILGPPIGGFFTTYMSWPWIFWINVPLALLGIAVAARFLPQIRAETQAAFDLRGFLMIGPGLALTLVGATAIGLEVIATVYAAAMAATGLLLIALYCRYAWRHPSPVLDLRLLKIPTFRIGVMGGFLFRVGAGATPFLLPLLLQLGFARSAFESGIVTFATGIGALAMKICAPKILRAVGFRRVLIFNAFVAAVFIAIPITFTAAMAGTTLSAILLLGGFSRSLQFTSTNAVLYADVSAEQTARASTFAAVLQELSGSIGISVAALALAAASGGAVTGSLGAVQFVPAFIAVGAIAACSGFVFLAMPKSAGASLVGKRAEPTAADD
ncbi:MAG: MFS transporter [Magnetospirillum sp.]|nr:MFS transporter [Magnetospirillum sp.]